MSNYWNDKLIEKVSRMSRKIVLCDFAILRNTDWHIVDDLYLRYRHGKWEIYQKGTFESTRNPVLTTREKFVDILPSIGWWLTPMPLRKSPESVVEVLMCKHIGTRGVDCADDCPHVDGNNLFVSLYTRNLHEISDGVWKFTCSVCSKSVTQSTRPACSIDVRFTCDACLMDRIERNNGLKNLVQCSICGHNAREVWYVTNLCTGTEIRETCHFCIAKKMPSLSFPVNMLEVG